MRTSIPFMMALLAVAAVGCKEEGFQPRYGGTAPPPGTSFDDDDSGTPVDDDTTPPDDDDVGDDDVGDDDTTPPDDDDTGDDDVGDDDTGDDDVGDDDTTPDPCASAYTLCGQDLDDFVIMREEWGAPLLTQNAWLETAGTTEMANAINNGDYPPFQDWPDVSSFPTNYCVGGPLGWGWDCPDWPPDPHTPVGLVLHHTAGGTGWNCEEYIRWIQNFHTWDHGWGDIGYQLIVCAEELFEGRFSDANPFRDAFGSIWVVGAHSPPNTGYVGVSVVGNFESEIPSLDTLMFLDAVLARVSYDAGLYGGDLVGHRDRNSTECPGDNLYDDLPSFRDHIDWCASCGY